MNSNKPQIQDDPVRQDELKNLFAENLGTDYPPERFQAVDLLQVSMIDKQVRLVEQLHSGSLTPSGYADELEKLSADSAKLIEDVLGSADFEKLFGVPRTEMGTLMDREIFLQSQSAQ